MKTKKKIAHQNNIPDKKVLHTILLSDIFVFCTIFCFGFTCALLNQIGPYFYYIILKVYLNELMSFESEHFHDSKNKIVGIPLSNPVIV